MAKAICPSECRYQALEANKIDPNPLKIPAERLVNVLSHDEVGSMRVQATKNLEVGGIKLAG